MALLDYFRRKPPITAQSPESPRSNLSNPEQWLLDWAAAGTEPLFGGPVSERNAMAVSAVYRCVSLISGVIASMTLGVYRDDPKEGRIPAPDHRLFDLFNLIPFNNRPMSSFMWKELLTQNILLQGNAYSVIRYDGAARVIGLEWAAPEWVTITRQNYRNLYTVAWLDREPEVVDQEDMLHIPGPGFDGIMGMSRIRMNARNAIALNRTLESAAGVAHDNAIKPSIIFKLPAGVSPDAIKRLSAHVTNRFAGRSNVGRPLFVDAGTETEPLSIPLTDLATIDALKFTIADISRFYGVPLSLLNENEGTTVWGSGVDSLIRGFLTFTLSSDLARIEAEINAKLLADSEYYALFDRESLLQMDQVQSAQATSAEINSGVLTINEARQRRHRPIVTGGDNPLVNSTLVPLSIAIKPPEPPPSAPPPQEKPSNDQQN